GRGRGQDPASQFADRPGLETLTASELSSRAIRPVARRSLCAGLTGLLTSLWLFVAPAVAQDHPCASDSAQTRGPLKAYRKECCQELPYRALSEVARAEGIEIKTRRTAQEPVPGYFLCVVDFAWQPSRESWRASDANFDACVASVKKIEAERKRSAPDLLYTPHDLKCGQNLDRYLC